MSSAGIFSQYATVKCLKVSANCPLQQANVKVRFVDITIYNNTPSTICMLNMISHTTKNDWYFSIAEAIIVK